MLLCELCIGLVVLAVVSNQFVEPFGEVNAVFRGAEVQVQVTGVANLELVKVGVSGVGELGKIPLGHLVGLDLVDAEGKLALFAVLAHFHGNVSADMSFRWTTALVGQVMFNCYWAERVRSGRHTTEAGSLLTWNPNERVLFVQHREQKEYRVQ